MLNAVLENQGLLSLILQCLLHVTPVQCALHIGESLGWILGMFGVSRNSSRFTFLVYYLIGAKGMVVRKQMID